MTTLPTYTAQVPVPVDQGPRASGFGVVGAAVQGVGREVQQAGGDAASFATRRAYQLASLDANDYVATQSADLTDKQHDRFINDSENAPPGAKGFTDTFMTGYDADLKARIDAAPNDMAKRQLTRHGMELRSAIHNNALLFERDAGKQQRQENVAASISKLSNVAISSPELYGDLKVQAANTVDAYKADMTAGEYTKVKDAAQRTLATSAISGLVDKDPNAALKALGSGQFDELIHPEDKLRLTSSADAEIKRREVEARAEARANAAEGRQRATENRLNVSMDFQDELAAAKDGKTLDPNFDKRVATAGYPPERAAAMLNSLNDTREVASISQGLSTMTPEQIAQSVSGHVPAGFGYAEEAKNQGHLEKAAADVLARRQKDPALEAGRAYPGIAQGMASDDPAVKSAAIRKSVDVQRSTFGLAEDQIQPLPKPEAARIVGQFNGPGSAEQKLDLIAKLANIRKDDGTPDYGASRQMLNQLEHAGLPPGVDHAMEALDRGDDGAAKAIMGAVSLKPADVPKLSQPEGTSVAEQIKGLRDSKDTGAGVETRVAAITGEPDVVKAGSRADEIAKRLVTLDVANGGDAAEAAKRADKMIHGAGPVINNDVAAIKLPVGADPEKVSAGLDAIRSNLDLSYLAPSREQIAARFNFSPQPGLSGNYSPEQRGAIEGAYNLSRHKHDQWADTIRNGAMFINNGNGFSLVPQSPGAGYAGALPGPDGKPRIFTLDEVMKAGAAQTPNDAPMGGMDAPGMHGGSGGDTLANESTDQIAWEALTGRKVPDKVVSVPAREPELGSPAKKIMTGPQAMELARGVLQTGQAMSRADLSGMPPTIQNIHEQLGNLYATLSELAAQTKKPKVRKVIRDAKGLIESVVEDSQ